MEDQTKLQAARGRKVLNEKNKRFLEELSNGVPVIDAYHLAGYTGGNHTAYELKRQLKQELRELLEAKGYSIEGIASELLNLNKLPVDLTKYPNGIPLAQKIQILKLFAQTLKDDAPRAQPSQPHVTAFIINRGSSPHVKVVETTATEQAPSHKDSQE